MEAAGGQIRGGTVEARSSGYLNFSPKNTGKTLRVRVTMLDF